VREGGRLVADQESIESITALDVQGMWTVLVQLGQAALFLGEARETALLIAGVVHALLATRAGLQIYLTGETSDAGRESRGWRELAGAITGRFGEES
jgi:hypothetical protein